MKFQVYKDKAGEWRWRLRAKNGRIVADSGEGYKRKTTMLKTLTNIIDIISTEGYKLEVEE